jgi:hypothetical protein
MTTSPVICRFHNDKGELCEHKLLSVVPLCILTFFTWAPILIEMRTDGTSSAIIHPDDCLMFGFDTIDQLLNRLFQVKRFWEDVVRVDIRRQSNKRVQIIFTKL